MENVEYFKHSDGWVFWCLGNGKLSINYLYCMIMRGDYVNRAIFNLDEINDGMSRLESEGYFEIINNKVKLTKKAKAFKKEHHIRFELCIPQMLRYCRIFEKMQLENEPIYKRYFTQDEYDTAVRKYCKFLGCF